MFMFNDNNTTFNHKNKKNRSDFPITENSPKRKNIFLLFAIRSDIIIPKNKSLLTYLKGTYFIYIRYRICIFLFK